MPSREVFCNCRHAVLSGREFDERTGYGEESHHREREFRALRLRQSAPLGRRVTSVKVTTNRRRGEDAKYQSSAGALKTMYSPGRARRRQPSNTAPGAGDSGDPMRLVRYWEKLCARPILGLRLRQTQTFPRLSTAP